MPQPVDSFTYSSHRSHNGLGSNLTIGIHALYVNIHGKKTGEKAVKAGIRHEV